MKDGLVLLIVGILLVVTGYLLIKREKRLYADSVVTTAKLVDYEEYFSDDKFPMFTMVFEYTLQDGTVIRAKEQSGSSDQKYDLDTEHRIYYSREKPELFILCGDNSRKYILYGLCVVGVLMAAMAVYVMVR